MNIEKTNEYNEFEKKIIDVKYIIGNSFEPNNF